MDVFLSLDNQFGDDLIFVYICLTSTTAWDLENKLNSSLSAC